MIPWESTLVETSGHGYERAAWTRRAENVMRHIGNGTRRDENGTERGGRTTIGRTHAALRSAEGYSQPHMARKPHDKSKVTTAKPRLAKQAAIPATATPVAAVKHRPSALLDTRVVYCGDNLEQLAKLPDACIDLVYIDPPFNSNRNYEVFWGETKEKRSFEDRHASTQAYIDYMRPRCQQLARVLKKTGSFYYHCDRHTSHYVS